MCRRIFLPGTHGAGPGSPFRGRATSRGRGYPAARRRSRWRRALAGISKAPALTTKPAVDRTGTAAKPPARSSSANRRARASDPGFPARTWISRRASGGSRRAGGWPETTRRTGEKPALTTRRHRRTAFRGSTNSPALTKIPIRVSPTAAATPFCRRRAAVTRAWSRVRGSPTRTISRGSSAGTCLLSAPARGLRTSNRIAAKHRQPRLSELRAEREPRGPGPPAPPGRTGGGAGRGRRRSGPPAARSGGRSAGPAWCFP